MSTWAHRHVRSSPQSPAKPDRPDLYAVIRRDDEGAAEQIGGYGAGAPDRGSEDRAQCAKPPARAGRRPAAIRRSIHVAVTCRRDFWTAQALAAAYDELIGSGRWRSPVDVGGAVMVRFPSQDRAGAGYHIEASYP